MHLFQKIRSCFTFIYYIPHKFVRLLFPPSQDEILPTVAADPSANVGDTTTPANHEIVRLGLLVISVFTSVLVATLLESRFTHIFTHLCLNQSASQPPLGLVPIIGFHLGLLQLDILTYSFLYWRRRGEGQTGFNTNDAIDLMIMDGLLAALFTIWVYNFVFMTLILGFSLAIFTASMYKKLFKLPHGQLATRIFGAAVAFLSAFVGEIALPFASFAATGGGAEDPAKLCDGLIRLWFIITPFVATNIWMLAMAAQSEDTMVWSYAAAIAAAAVWTLHQTTTHLQYVALLCFFVQIGGGHLLARRGNKRTGVGEGGLELNAVGGLELNAAGAQ